jgi:hypothetical protein
MQPETEDSLLLFFSPAGLHGEKAAQHENTVIKK